MRTFKLIRLQDLTGTSGTGTVAEGMVKSDGTAVMTWLVMANLANGTKRHIKTTTHYESWSDVILLHGHAGRTLLVWDDTGESVSDLNLLSVKKAA